jgi:hypothetical protein
MDFAWVVDALRRGLKVTRKDWLLAIPPMYLYMVTEKKPDGKHTIKMHPGTGPDFEWTPTAEQMLIVDDWEEYVEPKKKTVFGNTKITERNLTMCDHTGEEEQELDEETKQALDRLAKITADGIAAIFREDSIRRIIQKKCQKQDTESDHV